MAVNEWMLQQEGGGNEHGLCRVLARVRGQDEEAVIRVLFTSNVQTSCCETLSRCEMNPLEIMSVLLEQIGTNAKNRPHCFSWSVG